MKQLRAYFHPSFSISCHLTAIVLTYCHRTDVTFFDKPFLGGVMYVSLGLFNFLVGFMFVFRRVDNQSDWFGDNFSSLTNGCSSSVLWGSNNVLEMSPFFRCYLMHALNGALFMGTRSA